MTKRADASTRTAFLDAAERLFSSNGYEGMRIRDIASAANANLSALHYYWGNKEALIEEVCERRLKPVVEKRLRRYEELAERPPEKRSDRIAALLRAHIEPFVELLEGPDQEARQQFYTRVVADPAPEVRAIRIRLMEEMAREFVRLLRPMCGSLSDEEFFWRLNGVLGTVLHLQAFTPTVHRHIQLNGENTNFRRGGEATVYFLTVALTEPPSPAFGSQNSNS